MEWYNWERGTGKTKKLIELSEKTGAVIVSTTRWGCHYVKYLAGELGLSIPEPITHADLLSKNNTLEYVNGLLIDDAELFFRQYCHKNNVIAVTTSIDYEKDKYDIDEDALHASFAGLSDY